MVEFKADPRDGRPKLLEVNPRFWGSLHHAILSGVDFPHLLCRMAIEGDVPPVKGYRVGLRSRSVLHGELMHFASNPDRLRLKPGLFDFSVPDDLLSIDDPWPVVGRLSSLIPAFYDRELRETMLGTRVRAGNVAGPVPANASPSVRRSEHGVDARDR